MRSGILRGVGFAVTVAALGATGQCGGLRQEELFNLDMGTDLIAPAVLGGVVQAGSFIVPAGQTTSVTSDLLVNATGNVRIEGHLIAAPVSAPGGSGANIRIIAQGNIDITGTVQAASGTDGTDSATTMTIAQASQAGSDTAGGDGGTVELRATGNLTIGDAARITSGSGGHGEEGQTGGAGGRGGDMAFIAGGTLTLRGIHYGGNGGLATPAAPTSTETPPAEPVFAATGGDSGALYVSGATIDWPGYNPQDGSFDDTLAAALGGPGFGGGLGGYGGDVTIEDPEETAIAIAENDHRHVAQAGPYAFCPVDTCEFLSRDGGNGWFRGGDGGSITVRARYLPPFRYDGAVITARGGNGGNVVSNAHFMYGLPTTRSTAGGGDGGGADVYAGNGRVGDSSHLDGGFGGTAIAYGGKGGNGASYKGSRGGAGGYAFAAAGAGGHGYVPPQGGIFDPPVCSPIGAGGAGGIANAYGGKGGDGYFAGVWGGAIAIGGSGGAAVNSLGAGGTAVAELPEEALGIENFLAEPGAAAQAGATGLLVDLGCGGQ